MKTPGLLRKIFNMKEDYIEAIPGKKSSEEDKQNLEKFFNKVKENSGKIINIHTINYSELRYHYYTEFNEGLKRADHYSTGYEDKYSTFTEISYHFIIHYKSNKRIEEKDL